jgi:UDP-glucose 4-epimerase
MNQLNNKKILITGCAGYIGSILTLYLLKKKYKVYGIDNLEIGSKRTIFKLNKYRGFEFIKSDFSANKILQIIKKEEIETIIHLAAYINVEESNRKKHKYLRNNYKKTRKLILNLRGTGVKNFLFASTCAVNCENNKPNSIYGLSKLLAEKVLKKYANIYKFNCIIFRFYNVVGADKEFNLGKTSNTGHLFSKIITSLKSNKIFKIYGKNYNTKDGTAQRDYIHVSDLANIHLRLLKYCEYQKKQITKIIDCGYGKPYSVLDLINFFEKITKKKIRVKFEKPRVGDLSSIYLKKQNSLLKNFKPKYNSIRKIIKSELEFNKLIK